jgi:predicted GTPase
VVINKVDTATPEQVAAVRASAERLNPSAVIVEAASPITVDEPGMVKGKRVLVIEDGPTLTHGEMSFGAGVLAAQRLGAAELIDPRPFAVESILRTFERYGHVGPLLPAMGYGAEQMHDLEETIRRANPDVILVATPVDLRQLLKVEVPMVRAHYALAERTKPDLEEILRRRIGGLLHPQRGTASGMRP